MYSFVCVDFLPNNLFSMCLNKHLANSQQGRRIKINTITLVSENSFTNGYLEYTNVEHL